jgi:hypothetical protein
MLHWLVSLALLSEGAAIQGTVRAERSLEPIAGATVSLPELRRLVIADAKGYFVLSDVPAGRWRVQAAALGYESHTITITSDGASAIRLDFDLVVRPIPIPGVTNQPTQQTAETTVSAPATAGPPAARIEGATLRLVPGLAESDVLRALQVLPSVHAISDFSTALYVRGGASDQNLITLDGIQLFNPYHVGGIFSAIGASAVSTVDVWAGAQPARTPGDRLSSTVAIHTRDGGRDQVRTEGSIGLLSTTLGVDGPINGGKGGFLVAGRRTYIDAAADAAHALGLISVTVPYGFSDLYAKVTHGVGGLGSLSISGYLDREKFDITDEMREEFNGDVDFHWGSKMLSAALRQPLNTALLLELRLGYTDFVGNLRGYDNGGGAQGDTTYIRAHSITRDVLASADLTWYNRTHTTRFGIQLDHFRFGHAVDAGALEDETMPNFDRTDRLSTAAAYIEDQWQLADPLELRLGARLLEAGRLGRVLLPRAGVQWRANSHVTLWAGAGRYAQAMRSMRDEESVVSSIMAYDFLTVQPEATGLATGEDVVLSAEWTAPRTAIRIDAYGKRMHNLVLPAEPNDPLDAPLFINETYRVGSGKSLGIELLARHHIGKNELAWSYAFSRSERTADADVYAPRFERRHVLDASATRTWGSSGILSARAVLASGQPYTPVVGMTSPFEYNATNNRWEGATFGQLILGEHNAARMPGYFRLDVAARKTYRKHWFGQDGTMTPYLQILNVLNTKNVLIADRQAYERRERPIMRFAPQFPLLPSIGLEWKF